MDLPHSGQIKPYCRRYSFCSRCKLLQSAHVCNLVCRLIDLGCWQLLRDVKKGNQHCINWIIWLSILLASLHNKSWPVDINLTWKMQRILNHLQDVSILHRNWGKPEWAPHRRMWALSVCLSICLCLYVCVRLTVNTISCKLTESLCPRWSQTSSWTRTQTTRGPISSSGSSDGGYCMTRKTARNCGKDGESASSLSTKDFSSGD